MTLGEFLIDKQPGFKFQNTKWTNIWVLITKTQRSAVVNNDSNIESTIDLSVDGQWIPYTELKTKRTINFYRYYFRQDQMRTYHVSLPTLLAWEYVSPTENVNTSYTLIDTEFVHSIEVEE